MERKEKGLYDFLVMYNMYVISIYREV